ALYEHHAKDHRQRHSQQGTDKAHQLGGVQRDSGEDQLRLHAFAENHQEHKGKHAPLRASAGQGTDPGFDFSFEFSSGAHHEDDHAYHKESGDQFYPAFKGIAIEAEAREHHGPRHAADKGGNQARVDGLAEVRTSDLGEIGKRDPYNEGRFNAFS